MALLVVLLGLALLPGLKRQDSAHPKETLPQKANMVYAGSKREAPEAPGKENASSLLKHAPQFASLAFQSHSFDPERIKEWEFTDAERENVRGIIEHTGGRNIYFEAEETAPGEWEIRRSAFLGEYVIANDLLKLDAWESAGFLHDGYIQIEAQNRLFARVRANVSTLDELERANAVVLGDLPVDLADMNAVVYPAGTPDDPDYPGSWTLAKLDLEPVWDAYGFSPEAPLGRRPIIAVIDNGASDSYPDWHIWVNEGEIAGNGKDDDGNGYVDDVSGYNFADYNADMSYSGGHGSAVARIATSLTNNGLKTASPASSASLMRIIYYEDTVGGHFAAVSGVMYAVDNGADVVNCSFISTSSSMFSSVFATAREKNTLIVAAAGNNKRDLGDYPLYPVIMGDENLIGVGASDASDAMGASNYSSIHVDVFAPGGATSFATPLVSSTVALLRATNPTAGYNDIRKAIISGADLIPALHGLCVSNGRLNVRGAMEALTGGTLSGNKDPDPVPSSPALSIGEVGADTIALSWSSTDTVDAFEVEFSEAGSTFRPLEPSAMFLGNETGVLVEGLLPETAYRFRIRSLRGTAASSWTESASVNTAAGEPEPQPPVAPSLRIDSIGATSVSLSWSSSEPVDGFELEVGEIGIGYTPAQPQSQFAGTALNAQVSGLKEGTEYVFRIKSVREGLASAWETSTKIITQISEPEPQPPLAPELTVGTIGIGSVALSWSSSELVDRYELEMNQAGAGYVFHSSFPPKDSGVDLTGLQQGTDYQFRLRSVRNELGSSWTESNVVTTLVTEPEPQPPVAPELTVGAIGIGSVALSWSSSELVDRYELEMNQAGAGYVFHSSFPPKDSGVDLTGLQEGTDYQFRLRSVRNELGSSWTESNVVTTLIAEPNSDLTAPGMPTIKVGAVGSTQISLSWALNENVDGFELEYGEIGIGYFPANTELAITASSRSATVVGLKPGTRYVFRIRAVRSGLTSSWDKSPLAETLSAEQGVLEAPSIHVDSISIGSVDLSWSTTDSVHGFELELSKGNGPFEPLSASPEFGPSETGAQIVSLEEGADYRFRIRTFKDDIFSPWTTTDSIIIPASEPDAPASPSITVASAGLDSVTLTWSSAEPVDSYEVQISEAGMAYEDLEPGLSFAGEETGVHVAGLALNGSYQFRIRSVRNGMISAWAETDIIHIDGPEHRWSMDEGTDILVHDTGTGGLDLQVAEATWSEGVGKAGAGLSFEGNHDGIEIPDSECINLAPLEAVSIALWVKPASVSDSTTSVLYEQGGFWRGLNLIVEKGWLQANGWNRPARESDWDGTTLYAGKLNANEWNHVVLVLNGGDSLQDNAMRLYLNGELAASGAGSKLWATLEKTGVGQIRGGTYYRGREVRRLDPFQGSVDDLQVWCQALTPSEINVLYSSSYN